MRLLNTRSFELSNPFGPSDVPDYVVLSHRWGSDEITFADLYKEPISSPQGQTRTKYGFSKVQGACELALRHGYAWIWIDSCCIDKSSSAELQEAINSMWKYYAESNVCYVYMADVPDSEAGWGHMFAKSEWFTRGWTLQELIAPVSVEFYAKNWEPIGTKFERYASIAEITSINWNALVRNYPVDSFSVAERLSWAAHREVTKEEDEAYSLLGLFDVNMSLLYGEGRKKAFIRLQEAIYNATADHSIFLFRHSPYDDDQPLMADSPTCFCPKSVCASCLSQGNQCLPSTFRYAEIIASERWGTQAHEQIMVTFTPLRNEMSTVLPLLKFQDVSTRVKNLDEAGPRVRATHVAVLNHTLEDYRNGAFCLLLERPSELDACIRLQAFPAMLPNLENLEGKFQKTKLLICPHRLKSQNEDPFDISFSVKSDFLQVEAWDVRGSNNLLGPSTQPRNQSPIEIKISQPRTSETLQRPDQVFCRLADSHGGRLLLSVRLSRTSDAWSIREVYERQPATKKRKRGERFSSTVLADRCSLQLSDGGSLDVKLRRLPGSERTRGQSALKFRYELSLERRSIP